MRWGNMGEDLEEEEEIELSLGLSIGGAFRKTKERSSLQRSPCSDLNACEIKEVDANKDACSTRSGGSVLSNGVNLKELNNSGMDKQQGGEFVEQQRKRELHALRRQEARKKREEKQQKRAVCRGRNGVFMDDKLLLEAQEFATRVRDRAVKENEAARSERCCRKSENGSAKKEEETPGLADDQAQIQSQNHQGSKPHCAYQTPPAFSVVPMQYPFQMVPNHHHHHFPYVPFAANGFSFPCVMPYLAAAPATTDGGSSNHDPAVVVNGNVFHPVPCRTIPHFQPPHASYDSEQKGNKVMKLEQRQSSLASTGSPGSSSSVVSDYYSLSPQGASSSDTRGHSIRSHRVGTDPPQRRLDYSASSPRTEGAGRGVDEEEEEEEEASGKLASPNMAQSSSSPQKTDESNSESMSAANKNQKPPLKEEEEDIKKGAEKKTSPCLPEMPCVSTTGNGPNGKTISGFLYRYTKSEVSIMCVCHGNSFSPAEFVKHAGGTDISHPLKHIVVVPSAF